MKKKDANERENINTQRYGLIVLCLRFGSGNFNVLVHSSHINKTIYKYQFTLSFNKIIKINIAFYSLLFVLS